MKNKASTIENAGIRANRWAIVTTVTIFAAVLTGVVAVIMHAAGNPELATGIAGLCGVATLVAIMCERRTAYWEAERNRLMAHVCRPASTNQPAQPRDEDWP